MGFSSSSAELGAALLLLLEVDHPHFICARKTFEAFIFCVIS